MSAEDPQDWIDAPPTPWPDVVERGPTSVRELQAEEQLDVSPSYMVSYMVYMYRKQALLMEEGMMIRREIGGFHAHLTRFTERLTMRQQSRGS